MSTPILSKQSAPIKWEYIGSTIPFNKRNTKDINKIKYLNGTEAEIYKKRIKIEHFFVD